MAASPSVTLCLGNVAKDVSEGVGNDASELWHCPHTLHGERLACSRLPVCKDGPCNGHQEALTKQIQQNYLTICYWIVIMVTLKINSKFKYVTDVNIT